MISEQRVIEALTPIRDPELKHSIVKLGMVARVEIEGAQTRITLKLPLPNPPGLDSLTEEVKSVVSGLDGVSDVTVATALMTDDERLTLANLLHGRQDKPAGSSKSQEALANATPLALNDDGSIAETDARRRQIAEALAKVDDPEIHRPLTELGMVKSIGISGGDIVIEIALTVPGCPLKDKISNDVGSALDGLEWVKSVGIQFGVMSDQQRKRVAEIVRGSGQVQPAGWNQTAVRKNMAKRVIVVCSGKGGVGKSTTTTNLALALANSGYKVGILDADVYGFSIPRMTGIHGEPRIVDEKLEPISQGNLQVMSMGFFVEEDAPVIWRGPLLHKAINQFLSDVMWGDLDFLFFDLPPGTGDVTLTIAQGLPDAEMVIVTTPQPVATQVAGRVAKLAERAKLAVLGVIENMAYYENAGQKEYIFGRGGGKILAEKLGTTFLGEIPLHQKIREGSDNGKPVTGERDEKTAAAYFEISERIAKVQSPLISV
ncbi:MAG: Mrp/NBP35 family ATP-binding protein [Candidatus Zixiibacteriota bacterium]